MALLRWVIIAALVVLGLAISIETQGEKGSVLLFWGAIGIAVGSLVHVFLRSRGEEGYMIIGEALLGCVGAVGLSMVVGVVTGWRHVDAESGTVALIGALITTGVAAYFTIAASPTRHVVAPPPPQSAESR